jgi:hypothetical protein
MHYKFIHILNLAMVTVVQAVLQSSVERVTLRHLDMPLTEMDWITAALAQSNKLTHLELDIEIDHAPEVIGSFQVFFTDILLRDSSIDVLGAHACPLLRTMHVQTPHPTKQLVCWTTAIK